MVEIYNEKVIICTNAWLLASEWLIYTMKYERYDYKVIIDKSGKIYKYWQVND